MPSRDFPAPPDLSELLKFFESDEGKARVNRQNAASRSVVHQHSSSFTTRSSAKNPQTAPLAPKPTAGGNRRLSRSSTTNSEYKSDRDEKIDPAPQGWNASTQLPPAPSKALRHQLLCRTYQPPAPMYVVPSEASELLNRLAKGTISSRSKLKSQADSAYVEKSSIGGSGRSTRAERSACPADTRGRDAIQTLLFYRKEIEKRRRLDSCELCTDE
ncbi:unnamed protein product [Phytophthora lilii]|uniref:Unnamed protein product n=1 Tax=Phytophthora lilii TaxID=2077276 RepID=A0A9W6U9I6_9STRA|nr:unnamed protein product [Phytophthora lilii]